MGATVLLALQMRLADDGVPSYLELFAPWGTPVGLVPGACAGLSGAAMAFAVLSCRC